MPNGYINKGTLLSVPTMESRFGRDAAVATCNEEGGDLGYFFSCPCSCNSDSQRYFGVDGKCGTIFVMSGISTKV